MTLSCSFSTVGTNTVLGLLFLATPDPTFAVTGSVAINGTKLFTDTWYTIELKSNKGRLTWAYNRIKNNDSVTAYHVQLVLESHKEYSEYQPGAGWWKDAQWKFSKTGVANSFLMINGGKTDAWATFAGGDMEHAFVGLQAGTADPDHIEEAKFRKNVLWRITPEQNDKETQYYSISQEWFPEHYGLMFYDKPTKSNGWMRTFVQVYRNQTQPRMSGNSLWKFTPVDTYPTPAPTTTRTTTTTAAIPTQKPGDRGEDDSAVNIWLSQGLFNLCLFLAMICV